MRTRFACRLALFSGVALAASGVAVGQAAQQTEQPPMAQDDATRAELANFDRFLDSHPDVGRQLEANPSLVTDQNYLNQHPDLAEFLEDHDQLRAQIDANPALFMQRENRFEGTAADRDRDRDRQELANFDHFLDSHPEIAEQLRRNPSLVDDRDFVKNHPALQTYLEDHQGVSQALKDNPNGFMQAENHYDRNEDNRDRDRQEFANFDRFLDSHREIAEQLRKNPSLIDDPSFVRNHPALKTYLQDHPQFRDQLRQDPNIFAQEEARNDHHEDMDRNRRDDHFAFDRDTNRRHFGEFLSGHPDVAQRLSENPSLVKDHDFMDGHPELRDYLHQNPDVQKDLMANPDNFVKSAQNYANPGAKSPEPAKVKP